MASELGTPSFLTHQCVKNRCNRLIVTSKEPGRLVTPMAQKNSPDVIESGRNRVTDDHSYTLFPGSRPCYLLPNWMTIPPAMMRRRPSQVAAGMLSLKAKRPKSTL